MASRPFPSSNKPGKTSQPPVGASPEFMAARLGIKRVKPTTPPISALPKKRKKAQPKYQDEDEDFEFAAADGDDEVAAAAFNAELAGTDTQKAKRAPRKQDEEKRLRVFRKKAPQSYFERLDRVRTQRMFLIDRNRSTSADGAYEEEVFDIAGTTGNIYQVTISKQPVCSCPDGGKGNQCKHIIYVLVNVLKASEHLAYQLAFITTELAEIFANAPVTPQSGDNATTSTDTGGHRKPVEGDCPVCVMEFDASDQPEDIIWCKAACGNNIHRHCFEQWASIKPGQVKCVYCRTPWKGDEDTIKRINKGGVKNAEGYVNVASDLGLTGQRDMSSYHQPWVRREFNSRYGRC